MENEQNTKIGKSYQGSLVAIKQVNMWMCVSTFKIQKHINLYVSTKYLAYLEQPDNTKQMLNKGRWDFFGERVPTHIHV